MRVKNKKLVKKKNKNNSKNLKMTSNLLKQQIKEKNHVLIHRSTSRNFCFD